MPANFERLDSRYLLNSILHIHVFSLPHLKEVRVDVVLNSLITSSDLSIVIAVAEWLTSVKRSLSSFKKTYSGSRSGSLEFQPVGNFKGSTRGSAPWCCHLGCLGRLAGFGAPRL
jgi:hypothetical protein